MNRLERSRKAPSPVEAPPRLPYTQVFFYSLGHVFNDLCAATWFSYLLPFLTFAARLDSGQAGIVMFSGQIAVSAEYQKRSDVQCALGLGGCIDSVISKDRVSNTNFSAGCRCYPTSRPRK